MREVDEELRRDRAIGIWRSYGRWIVAAVVIGLIALGGFLYWQSQQSVQSGVEGEQLVMALDNMAADKSGASIAALNSLAASKAEGNRAAAKLSLADVALQKGDVKGAAAQFGAVAADASFAQPYRDLVLVRQTATEYDSMKPEAVIARLKPLAVPGNPWFGSAGEMVAIAYLRMNKPDLAAATFAAMARDETVPDTIRSRVVQLAGILGIDALPSPGSGPGLADGAKPVEDKN